MYWFGKISYALLRKKKKIVFQFIYSKNIHNNIICFGLVHALWKEMCRNRSVRMYTPQATNNSKYREGPSEDVGPLICITDLFTKWMHSLINMSLKSNCYPKETLEYRLFYLNSVPAFPSSGKGKLTITEVRCCSFSHLSCIHRERSMRRERLIKFYTSGSRWSPFSKNDFLNYMELMRL